MSDIKHGIGVNCFLRIGPHQLGQECDGYVVTITGPSFSCLGEKAWPITTTKFFRSALERVLQPIPPLSDLEGQRDSSGLDERKKRPTPEEFEAELKRWQARMT
jgi:hypothetical protein